MFADPEDNSGKILIIKLVFMEILLKVKTIIRAQEFLTKYHANLGGSNTAEGKGLIEPDRIVRPENLAQLSSQPAAGGKWICRS